MKKFLETMNNFLSGIGKTQITNIIAVISVLGVFGLLFLLCFRSIPKENSQLMYMAVSQVLGLGFGIVIGFYFGSSKTEADKRNNV
ncbi:MAG TPA: hypothetical protein VKQ52_22070 [Puia sp.]|nr:hypothetical protein [Puia sp.]